MNSKTDKTWQTTKICLQIKDFDIVLSNAPGYQELIQKKSHYVFKKSKGCYLLLSYRRFYLQVHVFWEHILSLQIFWSQFVSTRDCFWCSNSKSDLCRFSYLPFSCYRYTVFCKHQENLGKLQIYEEYFRFEPQSKLKIILSQYSLDLLWLKFSSYQLTFELKNSNYSFSKLLRIS